MIDNSDLSYTLQKLLLLELVLVGATPEPLMRLAFNDTNGSCTRIAEEEGAVKQLIYHNHTIFVQSVILFNLNRVHWSLRLI